MKQSMNNDMMNGRKDWELKKLIRFADKGDLVSGLLKDKMSSIHVNEHVIEMETEFGDKKVSLLYWAVINENRVAIEYLLSVGAHINTVVADRAESKLEAMKDVKDAAIISLFLENESGLFNDKVPNVLLPLMPFNKRNMARESRENSTEISFFSYSVGMGKPLDFLKKLAEMGILDHKDEYFTPLDYLLISSPDASLVRKVKFLIEVGAPIEKVDDYFETVILSDFNDYYKVLLLKLFVKEYDLVVTNKSSGGLTLLHSIYNKSVETHSNELLIESILIADDLVGLEKSMKGRLSSQEFNSVSHKFPCEATFSMEFEKLEKCESIGNRKFLSEIINSDLYTLEEKKALCLLYIKKGGDINETSDKKSPNLLWSISCLNEGRYELFDLFIEHGASVEYNKHSPLFVAISRGDLKLLTYILDFNADPNFMNSSFCSWIDFIYESELSLKLKIEILNVLLQYGLDFNAELDSEDGSKNNALNTIIINDDKDFLEYLIDKDFVNFSVPFYLSSLLEDQDTFGERVTKRVLDQSQDYLDHSILKDVTGKYTVAASPLELAVWHHHESLCVYLLDKFPDMKFLNKVRIMILIAIRNKFSIEVIRKLAEREAEHFNLDLRVYKDKNQYGPMLVNVIAGHTVESSYSERETHYFNSVLAILLENGADPNGVILDRDEPNEVNNSRSVLSEFSYWSSNANFYNPTALELLSQYGLDPMIKYSMLQENSLMKAIRYEGMSEEVIIKILAYFVQRKELDLEQTSSLGSTLLIIASQVCHPEIVGWLASNGANMNVVGGFDNTTALHKCISNFSHISPVARSATVKILLKHGVDVNELCPGGDGTPIMNAATVGAYQAMVVLIEAGGDVNGSDINGKTAAMCAVNEHGFSYDYEGSMESTKSRILNLLQEHGADLDTFSNGNESALKNAIYYGYRTIFESLLRLNVSTLNPDSNGVTPIMWAIEYGDIYFVERLLTYNPDLSKLDHYGRNVIYSCIFRNNEEEGISLINNFLSKGIRPNDLGNGLNILQIAAMNQRSGYIPILSSLADINAVDEDGKTPIINAITSDTEISDEVIIKTIKSLQDNGGDINLKDSQNRSAFLYAKSMERLYLAGKLKELGANASDGDIYINIL